MAALFFAAAALSIAQVSPASIALSNGVRLRISTSFGDPTGEQTIKPELMPASGDSFYRMFRDQDNLAVYAYRLQVDRPSGDDFHLIVRPTGEHFALEHPEADGGKPIPTVSEAHELVQSRPGEPVRFTVFRTPGEGVDVVDTITLVTSDDQPPSGALRFADLQVSLNQNSVNLLAAGNVAGRFVMFYLPGKGGYFFAASPVPGKPFVGAGTIDDKRMQFTIDNETFECTSAEQILSETERGEVWVYHDPNYQPGGNWTKPLNDPAALRSPPGFFAAGSTSLSWWIP